MGDKKNEKTSRARGQQIGGLKIAGIGYVVLGAVLGLLYFFEEGARVGATATGLFATVAGLGFVALDLAERRSKEARTDAISTDASDAQQA
ncbi:hypothetical protein V2J56_08225 [Georgenia sp. MJ206]|uniref:hypothetical protein n=1 Tax=Georgenia wangjunii TaxID=3117730 RepID=UPI002F26B932